MRLTHRLAGMVRGWNRTDILAVLAIIISLISMWIAYRADKRAHQANTRGAEAVAAALLPKVNELVNDMDASAMFIETFIHHARENPKEAPRAEELTLEVLRDLSLPEVVLPAEHLALLTQSDGDTATKLVLCISQRNDVGADIKTFSTVKNNRVTSDQQYTLNVLPYRMRKVNEACENAAKGLAAIVPATLVNKPLRGTIGEIADAEENGMKRKSSGLVGTLQLAKERHGN